MRNPGLCRDSNGSFPMLISLGHAARITRTSKPTIGRAIKSGRLSATRKDDGSYAIDPSELARVFDVMPDDGHVAVP